MLFRSYNPETGRVLWEENSQAQRSIASITKVMTAAVFLEQSPDLSQEVVVQRPDVYRASTTYLRAGYHMTTGDLLHLLLIGSDNAAARVLALADMKQRLEADGARVVAGTPLEFARYLKNEIDKWAGVIRSAGIKPE